MKISESSSILKLLYINQSYEDEIKEARLANMDIEMFLEQLLQKEVELQRDNGTKSRLRRAKFPFRKYLEDFRYSKYNSALQREFKELATLDFINNNENAILIGIPGSGKTHFAIGLGMIW